jgi:hypothetical protein
MTAIYLLSLGILAFVLKTALGTRELDRRRFTLPLAIVAVVGALYLRSIPTSAGDIKLITVIGAAGVLLGLAAGALMKVRPAEDGSLVTVAGTAYAAIWIAAIGSRLLFAYGASHWFVPEIASFSRSAGIDSAAYTAAFVVMALAMVLTRVAVTAFRAARTTTDIPSMSTGPPPGCTTATPTSTATPTDGSWHDSHRTARPIKGTGRFTCLPLTR